MIVWLSGKVRVNVRWTPNLNLSLTLVEVKLVSFIISQIMIRKLLKNENLYLIILQSAKDKHENMNISLIILRRDSALSSCS